jgi:hypothetical protein
MKTFTFGFVVAAVLCGYMNQPQPEPALCLMMNELNKDTGFHNTIRVVEIKPDYYITGKAWDHLNNEWVDMSPSIVERQTAWQHVTETACPTN